MGKFHGAAGNGAEPDFTSDQKSLKGEKQDRRGQTMRMNNPRSIHVHWPFLLHEGRMPFKEVVGLGRDRNFRVLNKLINQISILTTGQEQL